MSNLNGRVKRLEEKAQAAGQVVLEPLYPSWLSYPLATFESGQVRPGCYGLTGAGCSDWRIQGNHVHFFVEWLREQGNDIPERFDTEGECQRWINEVGRALYQVKAWFDATAANEGIEA